MSLATVADVEAILGEDLDAGDEARVTTLIGLVQSDIEDELGRPAEAGTVTDEIHTASAYRERILLNRWPIDSVTTVTEIGTTLTAATDYLVELDTGRITRIAGTSPNFYGIAWNFAAAGVAVTYEAATIGQLSKLCAKIVARSFRAGRNQAAVDAVGGGMLKGIRQLTIGRWSATVDTTTGSDPVRALELTDEDRRVIHRWRDRRP